MAFDGGLPIRVAVEPIHLPEARHAVPSAIVRSRDARDSRGATTSAAHPGGELELAPKESATVAFGGAGPPFGLTAFEPCEFPRIDHQRRSEFLAVESALTDPAPHELRIAAKLPRRVRGGQELRHAQ